MAKVPAGKDESWGQYIKEIVPGLLFCTLLALLARSIDQYIIPDRLHVINDVIIAILLGLIVKNTVPNLGRLTRGIQFSAKICLYIGIVLMGARLNLGEVVQTGGTALIMVAISITMSICLCGWLGKKIFSNERLGHLVGIGSGICGISAIMALSPVIKAKEKEILAAVGAAILTDIMVLLLLPVIGHLLLWGDTLAGFVAGVASSNTAQCIAIGCAYSEQAGTIATIVKSARNALMPIVILVMTFIYTRRGLPVGEKFHARVLWVKFPKFVLGLLIAAAAGTLGLISSEGIALSRELSSWFFVICFVGIGAEIDLKSIGVQELTVLGFGLAMALILGLYAYLVGTFILI